MFADISMQVKMIELNFVIVKSGLSVCDFRIKISFVDDDFIRTKATHSLKI